LSRAGQGFGAELASGQDGSGTSAGGRGAARTSALGASDSSALYSQFSQSMSALTGTDTSSAASTLPTLAVAPPFGDERWSAAIGQQALFMTRNQMSSAQLTLNPPHLGPIQVTLDLRHDQASAVFVSPHEAVRQAIEASLPQLRDMFSAAGLNLEQAQVQANAGGAFGDAAGQQAAAQARREAIAAAGNGGTGASAGIAATGTTPQATRLTRGLLDTFA
jgi:flagellar hook-length control protein FliK